jgi:ketosteroid isomerase-like protein
LAEETQGEAVVLRGVEAWNANDWNALEAITSPDVVVVAPEGWPESGEFVGWPAARRQFERLKDSWSEERVEIIGIESTGDWVLLHCRWTGKGQGSGLDFDFDTWMAVLVREGMQARIEYFLDEAPARRATGIEAG